MDSTCILIGLQVCFHSVMKHENDINNVVWLSLSCANLQDVGTSYIVFLFVNMENDHFIEEIKHVIRASIAWWKPLQSWGEFLSRWKPSTVSLVFTDQLSNSPKHSPRFSPWRLWRQGKHVLKPITALIICYKNLLFAQIFFCFEVTELC